MPAYAELPHPPPPHPTLPPRVYPPGCGTRIPFPRAIRCDSATAQPDILQNKQAKLLAIYALAHCTLPLVYLDAFVCKYTPHTHQTHTHTLSARRAGYAASESGSQEARVWQAAAGRQNLSLISFTHNWQIKIYLYALPEQSRGGAVEGELSGLQRRALPFVTLCLLILHGDYGCCCSWCYYGSCFCCCCCYCSGIWHWTGADSRGVLKIKLHIINRKPTFCMLLYSCRFLSYLNGTELNGIVCIQY